MTGPQNPLYEQSWPEGDYRFVQLGFVVADVVETARKWARLFGVGPFHVLPVVDQHVTLHGRPATASIQVGVAQMGPVQIELIQQHCDRPSIFKEWSLRAGPALHQVATVTADYEAKRAEYIELGYELAAESLGGRFRVAYFDTVGDFGFYTEVVEQTESFLAQLDNISRTCASWDGTDPVRLLTKGGYRVP